MRASLRKLVATGVGVVALVAASGGPAFAVGRTDRTGDTLDPLTASTDAQKGLPGYYNTNSPATDITNWSITHSGNSLIMDMDVAQAVQPCPNAPCTPPTGLPYPGYNGAQYMVTFQNPATELNQLVDLCTQIGGLRKTRHYYGHFRDGYRFYVALDVSYNGFNTVATPSFGWYTPNGTSQDATYTFFDLKNSPAASQVVGTVSGNHIHVVVPGTFTTNDSQCNNGLESWSPVAAGQGLINASAISFLDQVVVLPFAVPVSITCADPTGTVCEDDIQAIGGFITTSDWDTAPDLSESYDIGLVPATYDNWAYGTGCVALTPTFGGLLPTNPLAQPGQPCEIDNAVGPHYINTGLNF